MTGPPPGVDACRPAIPYDNLRQIDARVPPLPDWLRKHRR